MQVITATNVHEALPLALNKLRQVGIDRASRNGPVTMFPTPVTTVYLNPTERVLFWAERDANPFFHFFECLWMIAGRNDVEFVAQFANNIRNYSDDATTFHGAYGHRWRKHFGFDQLAYIINTLRDNPDDRRCVVQMWDAKADLGKDGKDFPCNTQIFFSRNISGALDMTVCNRSNDIVWGCYGANAVHFSFLQEFIASSIGCPVGTYYQVSNNLHAYQDTLKQVVTLSGVEVSTIKNPYSYPDFRPFPIMQTPMSEWLMDLEIFMDVGPIVGFRDPFFRRVVTPLFHAYKAYKEPNRKDKYDVALEILQQCQAPDWKKAAIEWIERRKENARKKVHA
jgi:hypothetical protein